VIFKGQHVLLKGWAHGRALEKCYHLRLSENLARSRRSLTIFCTKRCVNLNDKLKTNVADFSADRRKL
jgi:hypothetical protein